MTRSELCGYTIARWSELMAASREESSSSETAVEEVESSFGSATERSAASCC